VLLFLYERDAAALYLPSPVVVLASMGASSSIMRYLKWVDIFYLGGGVLAMTEAANRLGLAL